jgi:hypothetical protein
MTTEAAFIALASLSTVEMSGRGAAAFLNRAILARASGVKVPGAMALSSATVPIRSIGSMTMSDGAGAVFS